MRSTIFFLILAAMLFGGIYVASQKQGFDFGTGKITPASEWSRILPGRWKFKTIMKNPREIWLFEGEAEYFEDGHFNRYVTMKYYFDDYEPDIEDEDLGIVAGGSVSGTWEVDTIVGVWNEKIEQCDISNSIIENGCNENYNGCSWFNTGSSGHYGKNRRSDIKTEITNFSNRKIEISGTDFSEGGTLPWAFKRID